ncbi:MAG: FecR domain-containing protein [Proteobacteria bacterium]|nr:FecR domain-containing protein [Pseudomonadota bacterium]
MTAAMGTRTLSVPDGALAEAAVWIARLHGPERTAAVESGWRDWFGAHPDHATAWEVVTDKWNKSHAIPVGLVHPPVRVRRRISQRPIFVALGVVVAAASLLIGAALVLFGRGAVTTTIGEQKTLNLRDGTRIELNTATRLVVRYDSKTRVVELKSGEAYFSVAHEPRPFVVIVGNRKVIAVGTSFTVRRDQSAEDSMTVTLIEGRVAVAPTGAPNILPQQQIPEVTVLSAGERLQIRRHAPVAVDTPSIDRVTGWMRGQLIFDHTPLSEAVQELNRYSATRLSVASLEIGQIPVSGTFRVSDSVSFAHAAAETYNLKLAQRGDEIILEPPQHDDILPRE